MTGNLATEAGFYRKKPVVIRSTQWDGTYSDIARIRRIFPELVTAGVAWKAEVVYRWDIKTLEGSHRVSSGDWIIEGVKGEFYPCKPDIFTATYESAQQPPEPRAEQALPDDVAYFIRTVHSCLNVSGYGVAIGSPLADRAKALNERYSLTKGEST